jgi:VCBS repeat-containing protein
MRFTKHNIYLALPMGLLLAGCNLGGYDDYEMPVKNSAPVAVSVDLITQADVAIMDMLSATDADGDPITYAVAEEPTQGTLTIGADGQFTYQPNATVTGMDSFSFTASDAAQASSTATVNITIENQIVSFASYSRMVFAQNETDTPLPTNGRDFTQDVTDPNAYDDLIPQP